MSLTLPRNRSRKQYQRALLHIEPLESRTLLSASVSSYEIANELPTAGTYDSTGALWVLNQTNQSLDKIVNGAVAATVDVSSYAPLNIAAGAGGHIYMSDFFGAIDDVDTLATPQATITPIDTGLTDSTHPTLLTVTGSGAVWFVTSEIPSDTPNFHATNIGRWMPGTNAPAPVIVATGAAQSDSTVTSISANGQDSIWIGMRQAQDAGAVTFGTNRIVRASLVGSAVQIDASFAVATNNALANSSNVITSVLADGDGSVWFTLANAAGSPHAVADLAPDQIAHANADGSGQVAFAVGNAANPSNVNNPLLVSGLQMDINGNVWFTERSGAKLGSFDGSAFTFYDNPTGHPQDQSVMNADGTEMSVITTDPDSGSLSSLPIIKVAITEDVSAVVFTPLTMAPVSSQENTAIPGFHLATFIAPAAGTGSYSAIINWSNGSTSIGTVNVVSATDNLYEVVVNVGAGTFPVQGEFTGTVHIVDGAHVEAGHIAVVAHISDTPLVVGPFAPSALVNPNGHFVDLNLPITDDTDANVSWFTATINWGDGGDNTTGLIVRDLTTPGRFFVVATHKYKGKKATYTVTVFVTSHDDGGQATTKQASGQVTL